MSFELIIDPTGKGTLVINGMEFSEETIKAALTAHTNFEKMLTPEPYIFKAGDVAKNRYGVMMIIYEVEAELHSIHAEDAKRTVTVGQKEFEGNGYVKIGELKGYLPLKDYLPKDR